MEIITRPEWAAKPPRWTTRLRKPVDHVFIHHGATLLADDSREGESRILRAYQRYHLRKAWADIAYSFAVGPMTGNVYELRGWNNRPGATKHWNHRSYAICIIGDTTRQELSDKAIESIQSLLAVGVNAGLITPNFQIRGHRDVANKDCPGKRAYERLEEMRPNSEAAQPPALVAPSFKRTLKVRWPRMKDDLVRYIQFKVSLPITGVYDQVTAWHVGLWQMETGLTVDGVFGPVSYRKMFGGS